MTFTTRVLRVGYAALISTAVATGCSPPTKWEQPWVCERTQYGPGTTYVCSACEPPTWFSASTCDDKNVPDIYYKCVDTRYEWDFDRGLEDYSCRPEGIPNKFNDGTTPSFHCFGQEDSITDYDFTCEPYWMVKPEVRRRRGSGWFYWLALQSEGEEAKQFMQVAKEFATKNMNESSASLDATIKGLKKPTPNSAEVDEEVEKDIQDSEAREKARKSRTPEQVRMQMEAERKAWQSRQ